MDDERLYDEIKVMEDQNAKMNNLEPFILGQTVSVFNKKLKLVKWQIGRVLE